MRIQNDKLHKLAIVCGIIFLPIFFVQFVKALSVVLNQNTYFFGCSIIESYTCYSWIFDELNKSSLFEIIFIIFSNIISFYALFKVVEWVKK
jgi:hypothetical protein